MGGIIMILLLAAMTAWLVTNLISAVRSKDDAKTFLWLVLFIALSPMLIWTLINTIEIVMTDFLS